MALSIPSYIGREQVAERSERKVVEALLEQLSDDWIAIPNLVLRYPKKSLEQEIDVLLLNEHLGVLVVEVKGYALEVAEGRLVPVDKTRKQKDVLEQIRDERGAVAAYFEDVEPHLFNKTGFLIVTPNQQVHGFEGTSEIHPCQLIGRESMEDLADAVLSVCEDGNVLEPVEPWLVHYMVEHLGKSQSFDLSKDGLRVLARAKRDAGLRDEIAVLQSLDQNNRVLVTGPAGCGKTRLSLKWAQRASTARRSVLWTCYNDPLAGSVTEELAEESWGDGVVVEPFLRYVRRKLKEVGRGVPEGDEQDHNYWNGVIAHATNNVQHLNEKFQTVILDEVQDFNLAWLAIVNQLVDWEHDGKLLVVGDPRQDLRGMGGGYFQSGTGWSTVEMRANYRNAPEIARLLGKLQGAPSPHREPFAEVVRILEVPGDINRLGEAVDDALRLRLEEGDRPWVLVPNRETRSLLQDRQHQLLAYSGGVQPIPLVRWEDRAIGNVCESVHRSKGLEAESVILVLPDDGSLDEQELDLLLYSGVSRAVSKLTVLCNGRVYDRLRDL